MKIKDVSNITMQILESKPLSRDDDMLLYFEVCERINPIVSAMNFKSVLENREVFQLPSFESVSRTRRKIVESHPELRGSKRATDARYEKWKEVREYVTKI